MSAIDQQSSPLAGKAESKLPEELIKAQFTQMIEAIKATRERIHQLTLSAVVGLPASIFIAKVANGTAFDTAASALLIISPYLILAFAMFYQSERAAIRKYGAYVEACIDPLMNRTVDPRFIGWQSFITDRRAFSHVNTSDYEDAKGVGMMLLIMVYETCSVVLSSSAISNLLLKTPATSQAGLIPNAHPCLLYMMAAQSLLLFLIWKFRRQINRAASSRH
jgi:hypothetical protein